MTPRPSVIAFDVIETLFPLEPLRQRLVDAGQPGHLLEQWFARLLRDAFVLTAVGDYAPFAKVATAALGTVSGHQLSDQQTSEIVGGFRALDPHPDVEPAMRRVHEAGVQAVTLTNGSADVTRTLLDRAGALPYVSHCLSVDDVRRWKPAPEVYQLVPRVCDVPTDRVALVAAHAWDTHGAHRAGLTTGWVSRLEHRFADIFVEPDFRGDDLISVVDQLLALPQA